MPQTASVKSCRAGVVFSTALLLMLDVVRASELSKFINRRFEAVHFGALPFLGPGNESSRFFAEFTIQGPVLGRTVPIAGDSCVRDMMNSRFYVLKGDEIACVDHLTGDVTTTINVPENLGRPLTLSFDTRRDRLVVATRRGAWIIAGAADCTVCGLCWVEGEAPPR